MGEQKTELEEQVNETQEQETVEPVAEETVAEETVAVVAETQAAAPAEVAQAATPVTNFVAKAETLVAQMKPKVVQVLEIVAAKLKITTKQLLIAAAAVVAVIILAFVLFGESKFEKVKSECVQIAGMVTGSGDYFTIDTYPDVYQNMDSKVAAILLPGAQENALEAIKYANEELGFNGSVYNKMMQTTALMGRQSEENDKYKVSWTYHPDDGLEVTYEKK